MKAKLDFSEGSAVRKLALVKSLGLSLRLRKTLSRDTLLDPIRRVFLDKLIVWEDRILRVRDSWKPEERGDGKHPT
jgi:hypothetical protein